MKLEKLRINRKKKIVIGVIIFLCLLSAIIYTGSRAKYRVTESIPLVNGTINYKPYDMKMVGIYVKNTSNGEYENTETVPTSGYNFNQTKSYCTTDGTNKDTSITMSYSGGKVSVANLVKQGTKCYFYFDKIVDTDKPTISKVEKTSTEKTSITVKVTASDVVTGGTTGTIAKYYYSIDNGAYTSKTTNTHTFTGLTAGTSHTIKVKVEDASGNQSTEWSGTFTTESDKLTPAERIQQMGLTATAGSTSFTGVSTSNEGLKSGTDDDGTTYYFRGNVTNNWVQFAGFYWRIIRINGDGSIRMIYNGTSTTATGTGTQIGSKKYNTNYSDNAYVGYMYGSTGASTYAATHANTNNSTIKEMVDNWYKTNIADKGHGNKISTEAGFCNDRSVASGSEAWWNDDTKKGYGTNATAYGAWNRIFTASESWKTTQTPSFKCTNASSDLFTAIESSKGNKKLIYPIGLITADEVIYAGGFGGTANNGYYLYTGQDYWTMSPRYFYSSNARMFAVLTNGSLHNYGVKDTLVVRPVINLSSDVVLTGSGTSSDPYKVV